MQRQYSRSIGTSKIPLKEGELLCKVCFYRERVRLNSLVLEPTDNMEIDESDDVEFNQDENTRDTSSSTMTCASA